MFLSMTNVLACPAWRFQAVRLHTSTVSSGPVNVVRVTGAESASSAVQ